MFGFLVQKLILINNLSLVLTLKMFFRESWECNYYPSVYTLQEQLPGTIGKLSFSCIFSSLAKRAILQSLRHLERQELCYLLQLYILQFQGCILKRTARNLAAAQEINSQDSVNVTGKRLARLNRKE